MRIGGGGAKEQLYWIQNTPKTNTIMLQSLRTKFYNKTHKKAPITLCFGKPKLAYQPTYRLKWN